MTIIASQKGDEGLSTHPHPMCYVAVLDKSVTIDLKVTIMCMVCNAPFPLSNIIVYSCRHLYHLWCVAIWFKAANSSREEKCASVLHPKWSKSFGFASPTVELEKKVDDTDFEMARRMVVAQRKFIM
jgi:hypothetical protein